MFGNKDDQTDNSQMMAPSMPSADPMSYGMPTDASAPPAQPIDPYAAPAPVAPTAPVTQPDETASLQPAYGGYDTGSSDTQTSSVTTDTAAPANPPSDVDHQGLLTIKQEALQHLGPMVGSLEQSPEEKFKTLMMMIQASDDHTKLKEAFEMAKQITDDKVRAQALLDIINEINYFTQSPQTT